MAIGELRFHRPGSLKEACELGLELGDEAFFIAGGTEILPDMHRGRESVRHLVSLLDIPELSGIALRDGALAIGALVTIEELTESDDVRRHLPALAEAAATLASPPIRNLATIGGNFCRAVPCADTPPVCIAAEASVRLVGPDGQRTLRAEELFTGPRETALRRGELLVEIVVPTQPRRSGASFERFAHRLGSALAVASVAARVTLDGARIDGARIVLGAVGPTPILAERGAALLAGRPPDGPLFAEAAAVAAGEARPISDLRGSAEFRRELVEVLTRRALARATDRAQGAGNGPSS